MALHAVRHQTVAAVALGAVELAMAAGRPRPPFQDRAVARAARLDGRLRPESRLKRLVRRMAARAVGDGLGVIVEWMAAGAGENLSVALGMAALTPLDGMGARKLTKLSLWRGMAFGAGRDK